MSNRIPGVRHSACLWFLSPTIRAMKQGMVVRCFPRSSRARRKVPPRLSGSTSPLDWSSGSPPPPRCRRRRAARLPRRCCRRKPPSPSLKSRRHVSFGSKNPAKWASSPAPSWHRDDAYAWVSSLPSSTRAQRLGLRHHGGYGPPTDRWRRHPAVMVIAADYHWSGTRARDRRYDVINGRKYPSGSRAGALCSAWPT